MTIVPKTKQEVCTVLRYRDKKENERALRKRLKRGLAEGRQKSGGFEGAKFIQRRTETAVPKTAD